MDDLGRDFSVGDLRLMQGLAQRVAALRPELVNDDASFGGLAWVWGKDRAAAGDSWRRRLWYDGGELAGWAWAHLPHQVAYSDGTVHAGTKAYLAWQVHPDRPQLLEEVIDWYDTQAPEADHTTSVRVRDEDALKRFSSHGYLVHQEHADPVSGYWVQINARELTDLEAPVLPPGYRFRNADEVGPEAAVRAHVDAWHPSTFTERGFEGVRESWPYRGDLHVLVEAPDGTMVASTIIWLDEQNRTAEFEPVGTHQDYRRRGLSRALLLHGMELARQAGATRMIVSCLGASAHPAARGLYYGVGFSEFTRGVPIVRAAD